jgi:hypothetical protein
MPKRPRASVASMIPSVTNSTRSPACSAVLVAAAAGKAPTQAQWRGGRDRQRAEDVPAAQQQRRGMPGAGHAQDAAGQRSSSPSAAGTYRSSGNSSPSTSSRWLTVSSRPARRRRRGSPAF